VHFARSPPNPQRILINGDPIKGEGSGRRGWGGKKIKGKTAVDDVSAKEVEKDLKIPKGVRISQ